MKVEQLIGELGKYPKTAEVLVTWEGTIHDIDEDSIYQAASGEVIIDADGNFYKEQIMSGELRIIE